MIYIVYAENGAIMHATKMPDAPTNPVENSLLIDENLDVVEVARNYYVLNGELTARPIMPTIVDKTHINADGIDTCHITGIPVGALFAINGEGHTVTDGEVVITSAVVKDMPFIISLFPYLDFSGCVYAN